MVTDYNFFTASPCHHSHLIYVRSQRPLNHLESSFLPKSEK